MRKHLVLSLLNDWLYGLPDKEFENLTMMPKADTPRGTDDEYDFSYHLSECTDEFFGFLVSQGFFVRGNWVTYDPDLFPNIFAAASSVLADYDQDEDELLKLGCLPPYVEADGITRTDTTPWVKWKLGGDDDVDYNGSYILAALDVLNAYERAHPPKEETADETSDGTATNRGIG